MQRPEMKSEKWEKGIYGKRKLDRLEKRVVLTDEMRHVETKTTIHTCHYH